MPLETLNNDEKPRNHNSHVRARQRYLADRRRAELLTDLAEEFLDTSFKNPKRAELGTVLHGIADGLLNYDDFSGDVAYNLGHMLGLTGIR